MKEFKDYINKQIDEGFISDIFSFLSRTFGIDRWMYRHNVGLFSRNRYSGGGFFGNPWGNITDPMKRRRMRKKWEAEQKRLERERARAQKEREKANKKREKNNSNSDIGMLSSFIDSETIFALINSSGDCKVFSPEHNDVTTLKWIKDHYKDKDHEFIPSAWFQKNVKNYSDDDEFILVQPTKSDLKYYTALDCVIRRGEIILPWDDEDVKNNEEELSLLNNELIIPATYLAYNDQKGLENHIKRLQKQAEKEREKANKQ